jgi:Raf kinase inhibitor-like YbhB/YbcL family protein
VPRSRTTFSVLGPLLAALAVFGLVSCNSDGRTLRPAGPGQTQSVYTPTTTTTVAGNVLDTVGGAIGAATTIAPTAAPLPFTLSLPGADGGTIDARYTCNGADVQPQVGWLGAPDDAVELALVVTDTDAKGFVHWVIAGLDPHDPLVPENSVPAGAIQGLNGFSTDAQPVVGWRGPCPPSGSTHHYQFTLYALDQQLELPDGSKAADLQAAIDATSIAAAQSTGTYTAP